jgi:hypothetical protein
MILFEHECDYIFEKLSSNEFDYSKDFTLLKGTISISHYFVEVKGSSLDGYKVQVDIVGDPYLYPGGVQKNFKKQS